MSVCKTGKISQLVIVRMIHSLQNIINQSSSEAPPIVEKEGQFQNRKIYLKEQKYGRRS